VKPTGIIQHFKDCIEFIEPKGIKGWIVFLYLFPGNYLYFRSLLRIGKGK
jgi:hypothetical protein